jgi:hypothetical protein
MECLAWPLQTTNGHCKELIKSGAAMAASQLLGFIDGLKLFGWQQCALVPCCTFVPN